MNWVLLSIVAMIMNFFALVFIRKLGKIVKPELLTGYIFSFLSLGLLFTNLGAAKSFIVPFNALLLLVLVGIMGSVVYLFLYKSISISPNPAYPVAIVSSSVVIVTLISSFVLGTSLGLVNFFGVLIAVIGIMILSLSD
jgi:drug/metabolite transporter (DMT)-like permease